MKRKVTIVILSIVAVILIFFSWSWYQVIQARLDLAVGVGLDLPIGGGRNAIGFALMKRNTWVEAGEILFSDSIDEFYEDYDDAYIAKTTKEKIVLALSANNAEDLELPDFAKKVSENVEKMPAILYIEPDYNVGYIAEWIIPRYIVGGVPRCLNSIKDWIDKYIF